MKAISLTEPWAMLVAIGAKQIETRSWRTSYRGPLAIHAAKRFPRDCRDLVRFWPFCVALKAAGYKDARELPLGQILATCELYDCLPTETIPLPNGDEQAFGNFDGRRYAWYLRNVKRLEKPVAIKGVFGLWEWRDLEFGEQE